MLIIVVTKLISRGSSFSLRHWGLTSWLLVRIPSQLLEVYFVVNFRGLWNLLRCDPVGPNIHGYQKKKKKTGQSRLGMDSMEGEDHRSEEVTVVLALGT